jgi:hypothetical protein
VIAFTEIQKLANGTTKLSLNGTPDPVYGLEASTNLLDWIKVAARTNTGGTVEYVDPKASGFQQRFYRAFAP